MHFLKDILPHINIFKFVVKENALEKLDPNIMVKCKVSIYAKHC